MRIIKYISLLLLSPIFIFGDNISVNVRGLVCPSCAIGIKKYLTKTEKVKHIKLNVNKQLVYITVSRDKTLTDKEIRSAITNAGYEIGKGGIKRDL